MLKEGAEVTVTARKNSPAIFKCPETVSARAAIRHAATSPQKKPIAKRPGVAELGQEDIESTASKSSDQVYFALSIVGAKCGLANVKPPSSAIRGQADLRQRRVSGQSKTTDETSRVFYSQMRTKCLPQYQCILAYELSIAASQSHLECSKMRGYAGDNNRNKQAPAELRFSRPSTSCNQKANAVPITTDVKPC
eukprot:754584-Pleurochrysis_carterae.AAC.3